MEDVPQVRVRVQVETEAVARARKRVRERARLGLGHAKRCPHSRRRLCWASHRVCRAHASRLKSIRAVRLGAMAPGRRARDREEIVAEIELG